MAEHHEDDSPSASELWVWWTKQCGVVIKPDCQRKKKKKRKKKPLVSPILIIDHRIQSNFVRLINQLCTRYKPGEKKSIKEYEKLGTFSRWLVPFGRLPILTCFQDHSDESLKRWKASLGIGQGVPLSVTPGDIRTVCSYFSLPSHSKSATDSLPGLCRLLSASLFLLFKVVRISLLMLKMPRR